MKNITLEINKEEFKKKLDLKDGEQGIQGEKGLKGDRGEKGEKGDNGSPDTGEQIVKKINEQKELIDASKIKNLPKGEWRGGGDTVEAGSGISISQLNGKKYISATASTPQNSDFTYTDGSLTRIDYADGSYKTLTYLSGVLQTLFNSATNQTKTFNYTGGVLTSITIS